MKSTQIQGQLEVCDLEYCDYLECSFIEFNSIDEFLSNLTDNIHFKGIIVEKFNITLEKSEYIYKYVNNINEKEMTSWVDVN